MRIIGIDPGTGILGFGVIETDNKNTKRLLDAGVIRTPAKQADAERLITIYDDLNEIVQLHQPSVMVVEKLFFSQNVTTAMSVAQARGIVLLVAQKNNIKIVEMTPQKIKMAITGYGKADKKQIQEMVRITLKLKEAPKPDDCADAIAAALAYSANQV